MNLHGIILTKQNRFSAWLPNYVSLAEIIL